MWYWQTQVWNRLQDGQQAALSNSIKKGTVGSLLFVMQAFFPGRFRVR